MQQLAKDSVVIATADLCHHGAAYGREKDSIKTFGKEGEDYARRCILDGFEILREGKYQEYFKHCYAHLSDSIDTATVIRYLLGPLQAKIQDLRLVDVSKLFVNHPQPSWVAATLVALESINHLQSDNQQPLNKN